ncbi:MAG: hypothetical protein VYB54_09355 [Pseudomonadota bacterium]|nr:hypothetical protein [Pseudomonadota bacterium]
MTTSLIDLPGAAGTDASRVMYRDTPLEIPEQFRDPATGAVNLGALLKSHQDLRRQISRQSKAPETYALALPEDLAGRMTLDAEDPLARAAMDWARRHNLSQEAFGELAELFCRCEAEARDPDGYRDLQYQALEERLGSHAPHVCDEIGQWFGALLSEDFGRDPDLLDAAENLAADARGVLLLKALRDRLSERGVPGPRRSANGPMDEVALRRLQASEAYLDNRHPDHRSVAHQVREGWRRLVDSGR